MNNEEKILELLTELSKGQAEIRSDIAALKSSQAKLEASQAKLEASQAEMRESLTRVAVIQEGTVLPRLQLLLEGQTHLKDTLAPKERVEVLEDRVITLETVIKSMSKRLAALEKAQ